MPTGPRGEKRPPDVIANAVHVARIATGDVEETYAKTFKNKGGSRHSMSGADENRTRPSGDNPKDQRQLAAPPGLARSGSSPA